MMRSLEIGKLVDSHLIDKKSKRADQVMRSVGSVKLVDSHLIDTKSKKGRPSDEVS